MADPMSVAPGERAAERYAVSTGVLLVPASVRRLVPVVARWRARSAVGGVAARGCLRFPRDRGGIRYKE
jgi:hypothetical protein